MKTAPTFHTKSDTKVQAYDFNDTSRLIDLGRQAEDIWYAEWQRQGSKDEGTCCVGKSIEVWYVAPRKRVAMPRKLVRCNWVQGNLSASRSVGPALKFLKEHGIEATYDDGNMD